MTRLQQIKYVKEKSDIVQVISHFLPLKRNGSGFVGVSPFSNERTGSFTVHPAKGIFKCFSSGKGGDVIDFVMSVKGFTYSEALQWLIGFINIPPADNDWTATDYVEPETSYIDAEIKAKTMRHNQPNYFIDWLTSLFGHKTATELAVKYNIGTSKHWHGATIFWQIDTENRIRSGKIMVYNPQTGKRIKEPEPLITWAHKAARMRDFILSQCLYGEYLLNTRPTAAVRIVESEKTAIIASVIYPEYIWLASGSLTNLSVARCAPLKNRTVALIPDCGAEQQWIDKCTQLRELVTPNICVDCIPGNHPKGYDLCDYILDNLI